MRLFRDLDESRRLYASISHDNGNQWSPAVQTDLSDSPSLSATGRLPTGQIFLINNPIEGRRDPLAIRLSPDGLRFGPARAIRQHAPPMKREGLFKGPGFQYPSAVVVKDALWVVYPINKEDIGISRIPLASLG